MAGKKGGYARMKKTIHLMIAVVLVMGALLGCDINDNDSINGSGDIETVEMDYTDFTEVSISNAIRATVTRDDSFSAVISVDDNIEEYLNTRMVDDRLEIYLDRGHHYRNITVEADITLPLLEGLSLSGASRAEVSGFMSDHDLDIKLSGASRLSGTIVAVDADFDISGASRLELDGVGENLKVKASGASDVDLRDFVSEDVDISLSGASKGTINLNGTLDANLSGASELRYYGSPTMGDIDTSGASKIKAAS